MKKNSCTPINPNKYSCYGLKKIHRKNLITKKILFFFFSFLSVWGPNQSNLIKGIWIKLELSRTDWVTSFLGQKTHSSTISNMSRQSSFIIFFFKKRQANKHEQKNCSLHEEFGIRTFDWLCSIEQFFVSSITFDCRTTQFNSWIEFNLSSIEFDWK